MTHDKHSDPEVELPGFGDEQPQPHPDTIDPRQAHQIAQDLVLSTIQLEDGRNLTATERLDAISGGNGEALLGLLTIGVATGWAAGHAAQAPTDDRAALLANAIRGMHQQEMFGDCTEDGDAFPCRSIRAVNIVVGAPNDEPVLSVDDLGTAD